MATNPCAAPNQKTINLALQGGGAHGAFAWGVLDKLLEDGRLNVEGLCATSAGTMNACAYAYGKMRGGPDMARETLHNFWWNIHQAGQIFNPVKKTPLEKHLSLNMDNTVAFFFFDTMTRMFSPYQTNPLDINPLRDILEKTVDFEELVNCKCTQLFISTTHVRTGKIRVFKNKEVTLDVAMASACLPFIFKAVEINGEAYWDGGYSGNPALFPLFYHTEPRDILCLHINPMVRPEIPTSAPDIMNRVNEITFNSSLLKEMRSIAFVKKLIEYDMLKEEYKCDFKDILMHSIRADEAMLEFSVASKFNSDWDFLTTLRDRGRNAMEAWLEKHYKDVGVRDTVDLKSEFLTSVTELFEQTRGRGRRRKTQKKKTRINTN